MCLYRDMIVILCVYIGTRGWEGGDQVYVSESGYRSCQTCLYRDMGVIRRVCIGT